MRIAIIGGGAAGLISAWLLGQEHEVEVFEAAAITGGHVRTLGGNVQAKVQGGAVIENGVLGFHRHSYPNFVRLMDYLGIDLLEGRPYARLYSGSSVFPIRLQTLFRHTTLSSLPRRLGDAKQMYSMVNAYKAFEKNLENIDWSNIVFEETGPHLSDHEVLGKLQRAILMLSFSTPYKDVDRLPVGLTFPYLAALKHRDWCYVKGGVYTYMKKLQEQMRAIIHLNSPVLQVRREVSGIEIEVKSTTLRFDACVFATSPGQIRKLFKDPTEAELSCFRPLTDMIFETVAHTDETMYAGYDPMTKTPMDLFVSGADAGYNTYMNREYRIGTGTSYAFAYGMEDCIDAAQILDRQSHVVPVYNIDVWRARERIKAINGSGNCFYAGAWLGNGLHEGAVSSALEVARLIGAPIPF